MLDPLPWDFDDTGPIEPVRFGNIPPPHGARFEGGEGLDMSAFPGIANSGRRDLPGTPHPRYQAPPGWDYQAPPHTAPGAFYHPTLPPPSQMPTPYMNTTSPWAQNRDQGPSSFVRREDGFSSLAWRPPDYDMDRRSPYEFGGGFGNEYGRGPPPGSAPPGIGLGLGFGGENSGGYFANAGRHSREHSHARQHSHSRPRQEARHEGWDTNRGWALEDDGPDWDEDDEEDQMRHARAHLMQRMNRGHEDATDLIDSFSGMGLDNDDEHGHSSHWGRARSRTRHSDRPRHRSAMKRSSSVDRSQWPRANFDREPHRSRERGQLDRMAWPHQSSPYSSNNRLLENNVYSPEDRVRRPRDWRADYSVKPNLLTRFSSTRHRYPSDVIEMNDPVKRVPTTLLHRISSSRPPMLIDLRFPIQTQIQLQTSQHNHFGFGSGGIFPYLGRPPSRIDLAQMACEPPSPHMRFYHPKLPWYIDVMSASAVQSRGGAIPGTPGLGVGFGVIGLTVWEVIEGVWRELQRPITSRDFYNEEMGTIMSGGRTRSSSLTSPSPFSSHLPLTPLSPHSTLPSPGYSPAYNHEMYGQSQPPQTARDLVTIAFRARCKAVGQELFGDSKRGQPDYGHIGQGEAGEISKGVRRIDWLGIDGEWVWTGIVRKSSGMWEIKTRKV
ncbi:hypothetical protein DFH05DRAFT_1522511 [Lentinula detonsa]|uniref:DUF6699 domain-containing protein n=1 Tax=Lentinula detonsa TaxID=2804962 RepID=A0A9W8U0R3_9AGAR|nr:hypothetical protein DFH05DRAFT_1522511 [Lentinula detonsa]